MGNVNFDEATFDGEKEPCSILGKENFTNVS